MFGLRQRIKVLARGAHLSLALFFLLPLSLLSCPSGERRANNNNARPTNTQTAAATPSPAASPAGSFDGARAFAHVRRLVEIGPRPAGSAELARAREYMIGELRSYGLTVTTDEFRARTPVGERQIVNVTAELPGESPDFIIISSHYDTKLYREFRFVGANDGGSSTGAAMELARALAASGRRPAFTYRFVFFDGEEAFCPNWDDCGTPAEPDNTYGSRRYVAQLRERGELRRARAMLLLDMVGYRELELPRETNSTAWLTDIIWQTARELGHGRVFVESRQEVEDDHIHFLAAGIDAVDLIQLDGFPHWHTAADTLDKISPQSLQIVGEVVLASLPRIEQHVLNRPAS